MSRKTILIVEDEAIIAAQLQGTLDALGYTALEPVATGEAALAAVRAQPVDLILMDIKLHGAIDGITAAGHIQSAADIPIVYLTGYSQDPLLQQAKVTAPYGYLVKPVGERELASTLEMALYKHPLDRRLRESEERYRRLVDNASEAILVAQDGRLVFVNRRASELSGYSEQELTARPFAEFIHPDDRDMVVERHLRRLKGDLSLPRYPFGLMTRDSSVTWVEVSAVLIDWDGRPATLNFLSDITERRQADRRAFKLALERERTAVLTKFILDASHEFRTPLAIMRTNLYLVAQVVDPDKRQRALAQIGEQVTGITRLVELLSEAAQLDGGVRFTTAPTDLNALIGAIATMLEPTAVANGLALRLELSPDLPPLPADFHWMSRALHELLENALRFRPAGGCVTMRSRCDASDVTVEVQDTGPGIAPDELPPIFERFYRQDLTRTTPGFGLGLPIARAIIERHGGRLTVESLPGAGSVFRVRLPLPGPATASTDGELPERTV